MIVTAKNLNIVGILVYHVFTGPDLLWTEIRTRDLNIRCHITRRLKYQMQWQQFYFVFIILHCIRNVQSYFDCNFLKNCTSCSFGI